MASQEVNISGMSCAACASRIEKKLSDIPGLDNVAVSFASEKAFFDMDENEISFSEIADAVAQLGYKVVLDAQVAESEEKKRITSLKHKVFACFVMTLPVVLISMIPFLMFPKWEWVAFVLATPVVWWGGSSFHRNAIKNLRNKLVSMDTLISLGTAVTWTYSTVVLLTTGADTHHGLVGASGGKYVYFETAAVIISFVSLGKFLETKAKRQSSEAMRELISQQDITVTLFGGTQKRADDLESGDIFQVLPGDRIPVDGVVNSGTGAVDISHLTGESLPTEVQENSLVPGGAINLNSPLWIKATQVGSESTLNQIAKLVTEATRNKSTTELFVDKVVRIFVPAVLFVASASFIAWTLLGSGVQDALNVFVAVIVIACPCALGLATPTAIMAGVGRGSEQGILLGGGPSIEKANKITKVVFDKTGTLTKGELSVVDFVAFDQEKSFVVAMAQALAQYSSHPMSKPIAQLVLEETEQRLDATDVQEHEGRGVEGIVDGLPVKFGSPKWFSNMSEDVTERLAVWQEKGLSVVAIGWPNESSSSIQVQGAFALMDAVHEESSNAIKEIKSAGIAVVVLSGDSIKTTSYICSQLGVDDFVADCKPEEKLAYIRRSQQEGEIVSMVGDGINDTPALAAADLSIAMGSGTGAAIQTADMVIIGGGPSQVPDTLRLARQTFSTIKQNLFWAFFYNIVAIPLAAVGLLTPMVAAIAMSMSSVFVITNSLRLRHWK